MKATVCRRPRFRASLLVVGAVLGSLLTLSAYSQLLPADASPRQQRPEAPDQGRSDHASDGRIYGTVTDPRGNVIPAATVTLHSAAASIQQTAITDANGFFSFDDVPAGSFYIAVTAKSFASWTSPEMTLTAGQYYELPDTALQVASADTDVKVTFTQYDLAEEQIQAEEQQRVLGVFPNFYASYIWHAVPLTPGQKFRLALRTSVDPVTFAVDGATAGIEQAQNAFSGYGQGAAGYAKRFGAAYGDDAISTMIGAAILPSILHQDPRYFYKGTGSVASRTVYAMSRVIICRGDNGREQPNYSNVLGNLAAAGISNLYYPSSNRNGAEVTIENAFIGTAEGAVSALLQEFLLKKLSHGIPHESNSPPPQ